jgi:hypothetical protein
LQEISYIAFRGREDKLRRISQIISNYLKGGVLDVGCDVKHLSTYVQGSYVGLDMLGSPDIQANADVVLPFQAKSFNTVVAFDLLEHCDHIHLAFDELCRVSRSYLVIGLPNIYEWHYRLLFLVGKKLGGKYGLPSSPPVDRHRWLFGLEEARGFVRQRSRKQGFSVIEEILGYYGYRRVLPRCITTIGKVLAPHLSSLFAVRYWAILKRDG